MSNSGRVTPRPNSGATTPRPSNKLLPSPTTSAILVGVRVRPFNQREIKFGSKCIVGMEGTKNVRLTQVTQGKVMAHEKPKDFTFDYAFWTHSKDLQQQVVDDGTPLLSARGGDSGAAAFGGSSTVHRRPCRPAGFADQSVVYEAVGKQILHNVLDGYNSCLFAYGQTGSGKTYTMMGTATDLGVMPRLAKELFDTIAQTKSTTTNITVEASFCEIYNEKVRDLMASSTNAHEPAPELQIRQHRTTGIFVQGLRKFLIESEASFRSLLETGLASRATGSTLMNSTSSRSHAIVLLSVTQVSESTQLFGRLSLVDLAGSERVNATGATGATAQEGQKINLSLTTLGMCLSRLAEQAQGKSGLHIPYRDSSLTFLLSESLGGNSKTAMLANISPASVNFEETLSTLRFASIVKNVCNIAVKNENPEAKLVRELKQELEQLRSRLRDLQQQQQPSGAGIAVSSEIEREIELDQLALEDATAAAETLPANTIPGSVVRSISTPVGDVPLMARGKCFSEIVIGSPNVDSGSAGVGAFDASQQQNRGRSLSTAREVFVDWNTPQLINLHPDETSEMPVSISLVEGTNHIKLQGADVFFDFDGLMNRVTLFGSTGKIFLNGSIVEDVGTILRHRDRIVVGKIAMWFAHSSTLAQFDYNTVPTSIDHVMLLEKHGRWSLVEERSKDAMSIGKAFFRLLSVAADPAAAAAGATSRLTPRSTDDSTFVLVGDERKLEEGDGEDILARKSSSSSGLGSTPRSSNPLLAAIGDDIAMSNEAVYKFEVQLVDEYPRPRKIPGVISGDAVDGLDGEDDPSSIMTYDGAIAEQESGNAEQLELLSQLKEKLHTVSATLGGSGVLEGLGGSFRRRCGSRGNSSARGGTASPDRGQSSRSLMQDYDSGEQNLQVLSGRIENLPAAGTDADAQEEEDGGSSSSDDEIPYSEDELASQDAISEATSRQDAQAQIAYHSRVRQMQSFSRLGPRDEDDKKFWSKLQTDPPFLGDPALMLEQQANAFTNDFSSSSSSLMSTTGTAAASNAVVAPATGIVPAPTSNWTPRFICASSKYIFVFKKQDPKERCVTAVYILGATVSAPSAPVRDRGTMMLFLVNVFPSCGRHPKDTSVNGNFAGISLGFRTQQEAETWSQFITAKAAPPMPLTLLKRCIATEVGDHYVTPEDVAAVVENNNSITAFTPFGAAARRPSMLFKPMIPTSKYKSADNVKNCQEPTCGKTLWFWQKKHCEACALIFCPSCMDSVQKAKCKSCARNGGVASNMSFAFVNNVARKQHFRLDYRNLPHGHRLLQDFLVKLSHSDEHQFSEDILFRCDHFIGRVHTCLADAISGAERHDTDPQRLRLFLRDGTSKVILFRSAYEREQCLESIYVLIGSRVFISGVPCVADESDIIVSAPLPDPSADSVAAAGSSSGLSSPPSGSSVADFTALIRASCKSKTNWALWAGVEADRPIPFFKPKLAMFAVLGTQDSWSESTIRSCGLYVAASVPLGPSLPTLFVIVQDVHRLTVTSVRTISPVRVSTTQSFAPSAAVAAPSGGKAAASSNYICAGVVLRILETSMLVIGSHPATTTVDASSSAAPSFKDPAGDHCAAMLFTNTLFSTLLASGAAAAGGNASLPYGLDPTIFFDYTIAVNAPSISEFERFSSTVQVRSSAAPTGATGVDAKRGVTCAELILPVVRFHIGKFSTRPRGRPLVLLRKAFFFSLSHGDENDGADVTKRAVLWATVAFDRLDQQTGKMRNVMLGNSAAASGPAAVPERDASAPGDEGAARGSPPPKVPVVATTQKDSRFETDDSDLLRTLLLANAMPEYYLQRKVIVVVNGIGTAAVPLSACGNGEMKTSVDAFRNGIRVGSFELTLSNQCATSWRPTGQMLISQ